MAGNSYALCASKNVNWLAARPRSGEKKPDADQVSWLKSELGKKTKAKRFGCGWTG